MSETLDVVIVGGGLVGASLAVALRESRFSVALIEAAAPQQGAGSWDERCIAVNAASQRIFEALGVWAELAPFAAPILSTHISERGRFGVARFTAEEAGLPALGYNLPVRAMGQVLWRHAQRTRTVLHCPAALAGIECLGDQQRLTLANGKILNARLLVAADGAGSKVRELLGITAQTDAYAQHAIVSALRSSRQHQGCAYERFTPDGPIAVLPKPNRDCSLVWTVPSERVQEMLALSETEFLAQAQETFGERLGVFRELGARAAYPLSRVVSQQPVGERWLFAGNAAQSLHPVAAQGFNLGLRDVAVLAEILADAEDPGAPALLAGYEAQRRKDRDIIAGFTDQIVRLFSNRVPAFSSLRHLGLLALDLAPPLKQRVMWQNLGYLQAPKMARTHS